MAAAAGQPAIQAIAECGGVGNGDVEPAGGFQDASDFGERSRQIVEVFQTVVGNNGVESAVREGQACGVGLRKISGGACGAVEIGADSDERSHAGVEAACARSDIEHALGRPEILQDFVHPIVLLLSEALEYHKSRMP